MDLGLEDLVRVRTRGHNRFAERTMAPSGSDWKVELFGPKILARPGTTGVPTSSALKANDKLVVLYFSASW